MTLWFEKKPQKSEPVSLVQRSLYVCNIVFYQIVGIIGVLFLWVFFNNASNFTSLFLWHVSLSTAAYIPLMAIAVIVFSDYNLWTINIPRTKRYVIHGVLFGFSVAVLTAGIFIETHRKRQQSNSTHFKSSHAILGLVSWLLCVISLFTGLLAANTSALPGWIRPVFIKFVHNFFGCAGYVIGIASLWLKIDSNIYFSFISENALSATYWLVVIITVWSLLAALRSMFDQLKTLFYV
ncbi:uncharacterized protein LOC132698248 [Cylas formicarius]|uniref:uncharacterized protein LOC132698248 n=1 Tax=Cylas formicarius TaxID=197179 RepID=UPI0029585B01|nr:uncharacterized protein LOC132698248 [Cylas formicarius]